jgi:hypothetical protein
MTSPTRSLSEECKEAEMADDVKAPPTDQTPAGTKSSLEDILERLTKTVVRKADGPPVVKSVVVEWYAQRMMALGYDFTAETLGVLVDYLKGYNLWLCGNVGIGKTYFFDCMNSVMLQRQYSPIVKLSMIETQGWNMDTAREWVNENSDYDILIDDVGTEPLMKSWGQEAELFPYLLEKRMQLSNKRTHLTSNLGIIDIKKRYGERVADRFVQVFKMEQLKLKKSRRGLRPWKKAAKFGDGVE